MPTDFIALDVETANADFASICAIGLVHFRGDEVFRSLTILVDPQQEFDRRNIAIHGITPENVSGKPTMAQVLPVIRPHLDQVVVAHHSPFDRTALRNAASRYGAADLDCAWVDTLQVARRTWGHLADQGGYGLRSCADNFGITFQHHDAADDARCAGLILLRALRERSLTLQQCVDELWSPGEAPGLPARNRVIYPGRIKREGHPDGPLRGETVVFTGTLSISRTAAADTAAGAGANVVGHLSRATTILVVGDQDLRATKGSAKSSKHVKAEQMNTSGVANIRIIKESDFTALVS